MVSSSHIIRIQPIYVRVLYSVPSHDVTLRRQFPSLPCEFRLLLTILIATNTDDDNVDDDDNDDDDYC